MMKHKSIKNIDNEIHSTTSTELQADVDNFSTSLHTSKLNCIELMQFKIDQHDKQISEIKNILKEIKMPLIDKINKYKGILGGIFTFVGVVLTILYNLYNNGIQAKFGYLENAIKDISNKEEKLETEFKELNKKEVNLEIKFVEKLQNYKYKK